MIFTRAAKYANKGLSIIQFFPVTLWKRKMALEKLLMEERKKNPKLRYQIRLGLKDIELITKSVHEAYYTKIHLEAFGKLPEIGETETREPPKGRTPARDNSAKRKKDSPAGKKEEKKTKHDDNTDDEYPGEIDLETTERLELMVTKSLIN